MKERKTTLFCTLQKKKLHQQHGLQLISNSVGTQHEAMQDGGEYEVSVRRRKKRRSQVAPHSKKKKRRGSRTEKRGEILQPFQRLLVALSYTCPFHKLQLLLHSHVRRLQEMEACYPINSARCSLQFSLYFPFLWGLSASPLFGQKSSINRELIHKKKRSFFSIIQFWCSNGRNKKKTVIVKGRQVSTRGGEHFSDECNRHTHAYMSL